jgi:hypothetical protein
MPVDRFLHPLLGHSEKVMLLTDLEYRVWTQYLMSADDFGVMRASAVTLQDDNGYLESKPVKIIQRCLDRLITIGLIAEFGHQGRRHVFQPDWQKWQKVEYPRATLLPIPDSDKLALCDEPTRKLFTLHPGGRGERFAWAKRKSGGLPDISPGEPETSSTNARVRAREVANGERLVASGSSKKEGAVDVPRMDVWWLEALELYPEHRRRSGFRIQQLFVDAMLEFSEGPSVAWSVFKANLGGNVISHEWRVKGMVPALDRYIADGLWKNLLPYDAPVAEKLSARTNRTLAAAAEAMKEPA